MASGEEPVVRVRSSERRGYDLPSMERLLEHCDKNIAVFQEAIAKEERLKEEYSGIVRVLKEKAAAEALAAAVPASPHAPGLPRL